MSERLNHRHEDSHEINRQDFDKFEKKLEHDLESKAKNATHEHKESIDKILNTIEREAKKTGETSLKIQTPESHRKKINSVKASQPIRGQTLQSNLKKIQKDLSIPERKFSNIIHKPAIETVSEAASKTLARPSGLLFGGIFALAGNLLTLALSRYYGYEYNYLIGVMSFAAGFFLGLIFELSYRKMLR